MASFTLSPTLYGKVVGRFVAEVTDGADADVSPDATPLTGTVTFTASASKLLIAGATPDPTTVYPQPVVGTLDSSGYLTVNGLRGVWLIATNDPGTNPTGFTYKVTYNLLNGGQVVSKESFDIQVPAADPNIPDTWTDLTVRGTVAAANGTPTVVGPPGPGNNLTIGTVTTGTPAATITGQSPNQVLNLVLPNGAAANGTVTQVNGQNPDNLGHISLSATNVGAVDATNGNVANGYAELDSSGMLDPSVFPNLTNILPTGMVMYVNEVSGSYPLRPTARTDVKVLWFGADQPTVVSSGTGGMLDGQDSWFQTT